MKTLRLISMSLLPLLLSAQATAVDSAGKTMITKGKVEAFQQQQSRSLKRRSPIFDIDTVKTSDKSKAQFRMSDGSLLALKANTTLLVSEYQYQPGAEENSMVLELVEGSLRSVTGAIKANNGDYQLKTPVGSIGIRGTHFEIEIIDGDLFLAVWDGAIDLTLGSGDNTVSLGEGEDFSFGIVTEEGEVTELLEAPENFNQGHSSDTNEEDENNNDQNGNEDEQQGSSNSQTAGNNQSNEQNDEGNNNSDGSDDNENPLGNTGLADNNLPNPGGDGGTTGEGENNNLQEEIIEETITSTTPATPEMVAARTGQFTFGNVIDSSVTSSAGGASNLQLSMTVDFDNGLVPTGELTLNDNGGQWFAAFNGIINQAELDLGVNFATHGNNLADGDINAIFTDRASKLSGRFNLFEVNNPASNTSGSYLIE